MEWKKDLYTLVKRGILDEFSLEKLVSLPNIRDKVFFPDYNNYCYLPTEIDVDELDTIVTINFHLISISTNRLLYLNYSFIKKQDQVFNGGFNDMIFNLTRKEENKIDMDILVKNRFDIDLKPNYNRIDNYEGDFLKKIEECLSKIKFNYDTYALDIINGENWDRNAWRDLRD